ncbi:3-deoxy-7-phosphoheptulonate synthase [Candidatus Bathyarchaeota archaeon]|nr:MAG: 3-deoxy-7-phosphoheptulonate synthase [Candidatus Bathyarchaeota archaeon]
MTMSIKISSRIKLAANRGEKTIVQVGDVSIGAEKVTVIAGPCSVESREQMLEVARSVKASGAAMIRGGAFKPRTLPYSFQGLGVEGLKILAEAREETGLPVVTEVISPENVGIVEEYADVLQIGARNMQNYPLLKRVGEASKPVLLKRGLSSTIEEWLGAAEYVLAGGNEEVILCERGIRTYQKLTRFTLDLSAVPLLKEVSPLPVVVDPSHGTGIRSLISPMAKAAVAAGADGLLIEVHPNPEEAKSDGPQSLRPKEFRELMIGLDPVAQAVGRSL